MIPWRRYREIAYGVLGWTADDFARSTIRDLSEGIAGWVRANGGDGGESNAPSDDEMERLLEAYGA